MIAFPVVTDVTGTVPNIPDDALEQAMAKVQSIMEGSIRTTIVVQGRPPWPPRKNGVAGALLGGVFGRIYRSVHGEHDSRSASAFVVNTVHQHGAIIHHPGVGYTYIGVRNTTGKLKMKLVQNPGGRKLMVFVANGQLVFTQTVRPHLIPIPQREYATLQPEDITNIKQSVPQSIIERTLHEPVGKNKS